MQIIVGSFLYYGRALDYTISGVNKISTIQANPTQHTPQECDQMLDYVATYLDVHVRFYANDMFLHIDSDAAHLVMHKAKSHMFGYYNLSGHIDKKFLPKLNGATLVTYKNLLHVVTCSAESETVGVFLNDQMDIPICHALEGFGYPQRATPLKTDKSTANRVVHNNINSKRSKA